MRPIPASIFVPAIALTASLLLQVAGEDKDSSRALDSDPRVQTPQVAGPAGEPIAPIVIQDYSISSSPPTNLVWSLDGLPAYTVAFQRSGTNWLEASGGISNLALWSPTRPSVTRSLTNAGWITTFSTNDPGAWSAWSPFRPAAARDGTNGWVLTVGTNDSYLDLQVAFAQGVQWGVLARQRNPDLALAELVGVALRLMEASQQQAQQRPVDRRPQQQ